MQTTNIIKKPLVPQVIHDDTTRFITIYISLAVLVYILYKIMASFNR